LGNSPDPSKQPRCLETCAFRGTWGQCRYGDRERRDQHEHPEKISLRSGEIDSDNVGAPLEAQPEAPFDLDRSGRVHLGEERRGEVSLDADVGSTAGEDDERRALPGGERARASGQGGDQAEHTVDSALAEALAYRVADHRQRREHLGVGGIDERAGDERPLDGDV